MSDEYLNKQIKLTTFGLQEGEEMSSLWTDLARSAEGYEEKGGSVLFNGVAFKLEPPPSWTDATKSADRGDQKYVEYIRHEGTTEDREGNWNKNITIPAINEFINHIISINTPNVFDKVGGKDYLFIGSIKKIIMYPL